MKVSEIFFSVQGEGINIGKPSVFLRLQGCNLRCKWCDTPYALAPNLGKEMKIEQVKEEIEKYPCKRVVVTGGEPFLQWAELRKLIDSMPDYKFEIETNGTIVPDDIPIDVLLNVSPKPPSSGNNMLVAYKPENLRLLNKRLTIFKFVVSDKKDFKWVQEVIRDCELNYDKIIIMPEGRTQEEIRRSALKVIEDIKKEGFRIMPRLQIMLWGNKKGI